MDSMFGPLEEMFDLNDDGKLDPIEFGVMMEVITDGDKDIELHTDSDYDDDDDLLDDEDSYFNDDEDEDD